jgi:N-acetylglucosamine malate deacetylase 1
VIALPLPVPRATAIPRGKVAVLAPHPDDEVAGPGGALALHRQQGDPLRALIVTDGRAGNVSGDLPSAQYVELRRRESRAAAAAIGGMELTFWDYPDGCVITESALAETTERAIEWLKLDRPDVVYAPWPGESHSDHAAVAEIARRALSAIDFQGTLLGFEIWSAGPADAVIDITAVAERKREALLCYASQLEFTAFDHFILGLNAWRALYGPKGGRYAEGFVTWRR